MATTVWLYVGVKSKHTCLEIWLLNLLVATTCIATSRVTSSISVTVMANTIQGHQWIEIIQPKSSRFAQCKVYIVATLFDVFFI